jgi:hypothetical protein
VPLVDLFPPLATVHVTVGHIGGVDDLKRIRSF